MAEHSMFQKDLQASLKGSGLTIGQPKVLDYLKDHDGAEQNAYIAFKPYGRMQACGAAYAEWKPPKLFYLSDGKREETAEAGDAGVYRD